MNTEKIAYWFFRLNGCFTFENFIVHPDEYGPQRTDADLISLRFKHRQELRTSEHPMEDHPFFQGQENYASVFFVEVKKGECSLNGPWRNPDKRNLQCVLNALGFIAETDIDEVSRALYQDYKYVYREDISIGFAMIGQRQSIRRDWQHIPQLTWNEILHWMYYRYVTYAEQKASNRQWDEAGKKLYRSATRRFEKDENGFVEHWLRQVQIIVDKPLEKKEKGKRTKSQRMNNKNK